MGFTATKGDKTYLRIKHGGFYCITRRRKQASIFRIKALADYAIKIFTLVDKNPRGGEWRTEQE